MPLESLRTLVPVYLIGAALVVVLVLPLGARTRTRWRRSVVLVIAAIIGGAIGAATVWWVADVQDVFGVALSDVVHNAVTAAGAALALAVVNLVRTRWWRKIVAIVTVPVVLLACGLIINEDIAYFPRLGDVLGYTGVHPLAVTRDDRPVALAAWTPPADLPHSGVVGTVTIPATESHFDARPALVYLPPAARVRHPPRLPVIIALSGQPGTPSDIVDAGHIGSTMNAIAVRHHGIAPIVVVPDQLGPSEGNPMCVNSKLGNVATYLTVDVRDWVLRHLPVAIDRREWTVAGFSEGGTCAIQLAAGYPAVFGSLIDVSGEIAPSDGSVATTIATGFRGDRHAYEQATPYALLRAHRHYPATRALFAVGAEDFTEAPVEPAMAAHARRAGMHTSLWVVPNSGHNWHVATVGLAWGADRLVPWWGLPS